MSNVSEQYDIYYKGNKVAYFRLRHGILSVHPYKHGEIDWETDLYYKLYYDKRGYFENSDENKKEFNKIKFKVNLLIYWYLFKQHFK